jgi:hypothetical protein
VKADPAIQRQLLELADVDAQLSRIVHRRRTLPELAELAELDKTLRQHRDAVVRAETALSDLDVDAARQEKDIDAVRAREDRDRKLLDSGLPGKQQTELEHELGTLQRRQSALEDDLLEIMEQREALDADVQHSKAQLSESEQAAANAEARRDTTLGELDTQQARRDADRAALAGKFPEPVLKLYEKLRAQRGVGAALLRARRCGACQLELDRTAINDLKAAAPDEITRCEECGAILVRTAESGL